MEQGFIWGGGGGGGGGGETRVSFPPKRKCFPPKPFEKARKFFLIIKKIPQILF